MFSILFSAPISGKENLATLLFIRQLIAYYFYICLVLIKNIYNTFNCLIPFYKRIEPGKSCQVARKGKFAVRSERWNLREDEDKEPFFHIEFAFLSIDKMHN